MRTGFSTVIGVEPEYGSVSCAVAGLVSRLRGVRETLGCGDAPNEEWKANVESAASIVRRVAGGHACSLASYIASISLYSLFNMHGRRLVGGSSDVTDADYTPVYWVPRWLRRILTSTLHPIYSILDDVADLPVTWFEESLAVAAAVCKRPVVVSVVGEAGRGFWYRAARLGLAPGEVVVSNVPAYTGPEVYIPVFDDDGRRVAMYILSPRSEMEVHHGVLYRLGRDNILRPARLRAAGVGRLDDSGVVVYSERLARIVKSTGVTRRPVVVASSEYAWRLEVGGKAVVAPALLVSGDKVEGRTVALVETGSTDTVRLVDPLSQLAARRRSFS